VAHTLTLIQLASDIMAMAAALTSLADTALRHRNARTSKQ